MKTASLLRIVESGNVCLAVTGAILSFWWLAQPARITAEEVGMFRGLDAAGMTAQSGYWAVREFINFCKGLWIIPPFLTFAIALMNVALALLARMVRLRLSGQPDEEIQHANGLPI